MIESTVLNLEALGNTILAHSNLNSNLFEVNNTLDGQSNNGCGCPIKPIDPLNSTQSSEFYYQSSEFDLFSNQIVVNNYDESESRFLLETSDPFIQVSQGVNLENINFSENSNSIRDREINSEFGNSSASVGEEESLIQSESPFQITQPVGIFDSQGKLTGVKEGGITTVLLGFDFAGGLAQLTYPTVGNYTVDLFFDSRLNELKISDSLGNVAQGVIDPITGNVFRSSVSINPGFVDPTACEAAVVILFASIAGAFGACGTGFKNKFEFLRCIGALGGTVAAALNVKNSCLPLLPISTV